MAEARAPRVLRAALRAERSWEGLGGRRRERRRGRCRRGSGGELGLDLNLPPELERIRDAVETFARAARSGDDNRAEAKQPPGERLVDADAFHLLEQQLERVPPEQTHLDQHAPVRDDEL